MPNYHFTIGGGPSCKGETATLPDDAAAWDYGEALIRGLLQSDVDADESRILIITKDGRIVASIAFNITALRNHPKPH